MTKPRASRRKALAFIALQDLPMPTGVTFRDPGDAVSLSLQFDRIDTARRWESAFNGSFWGSDPRVFTDADGAQWRSSVRYLDGWRGWNVQLSATEPLAAEVEPLDEDTASALREIAGGDES